MTSGDGCVVITRCTRAPRLPQKSGSSRCRCTLPRCDSHGRTCRTGRSPVSASASSTANCRGHACPPSAALLDPAAAVGVAEPGRLPIGKIDRRRAVDRRPHVGHAQDLHRGQVVRRQCLLDRHGIVQGGGRTAERGNCLRIHFYPPPPTFRPRPSLGAPRRRADGGAPPIAAPPRVALATAAASAAATDELNWLVMNPDMFDVLGIRPAL